MCHDKNPSFPPSNIDIIRMVWLTHSYNVRLPHETYWLPGLSSLSGHTLSSFYLNSVTYCQVGVQILNKEQGLQVSKIHGKAIFPYALLYKLKLTPFIELKPESELQLHSIVGYKSYVS